MTGTLITEKNADFFLPVIPTEALIRSDIFIGAIDEETGTACGVLSVEAQEEHVLALRYIYVAEEMRRRGAGRAMINMLQEVAVEIDASSIVCSSSWRGENDSIRELLLSGGFSPDMSSPVPVYSIPITEKDPGEIEYSGRIVRISDMTNEEKYEFIKEWSDRIRKEKRNFEEFAPYHGIDMKYSFAAYDIYDNPCGMLLVSTRGDEITLEMIAGRGKDEETVCEALLRRMIKEVQTEFKVNTGSPEKVKLIADIEDAAIREKVYAIAGGVDDPDYIPVPDEYIILLTWDIDE